MRYRQYLYYFLGGLHFSWLAALLPLTLLNLKSLGQLPTGGGTLLWIYLTCCLPIIFLIIFDAITFPVTLAGILLTSGSILSNVLFVLLTPSGQIFASANLTLFLYQVAQVLGLLAFTLFFILSRVLPESWSNALTQKTGWSALITFKKELPHWYFFVLLGFLGISFYYAHLFFRPVFTSYTSLSSVVFQIVALLFYAWQIIVNFRPFYLNSIVGQDSNPKSKTSDGWIPIAAIFLVISMVSALFVFISFH
jgi:hypothetical protein